MSERNERQSAFPVPEERNEEGMELRDYFAAKAMQGHVVGFSNIVLNGGEPAWDKLIAERSYNLADAMLAERLK